MEYLAPQHFDEAYASVRSYLNEPDSISSLDSFWDSWRDELNQGSLEYCLRSYVTAELDFQTPGDRGLGRVSLSPPRLGGHFRSQLGRLSASELWALYYRIQTTILSAYIGYAWLMEEPRRPAVVTAAEDLYRLWIPLIYSSGGRPSENVLDAVLAVTVPAANSLIEHLRGIGIDAVGLPGNQIVFQYLVAGLDLRGVEVGYAS